MPLQRR